ncbi:hypothetical protein CTM97_16050 [Photobacterium phosphoreum]|uniref:Uncharacterized protein n=1 Tax=Photobacterium phosphoreum TaxID=659 RepID=A0A2T3JTB3_PHOPO|nr:hypothetical protein [Photobacterium phosphoreum]PSU21217.1 hypothetical protein CTM96_18115 [Photobacterium phosphoreum]PSU40181.1 hypothetical protein CTM97_16050 [Photobacterium phosphoreum]PSU52385.1 hypothetical protein C9J18_09585 [Photobacterium phosphoreum]
MSIDSKINNIIEIAETFHNVDSQFLLAALNKCKNIFDHEFSLKNELFNVDGIFNYVLSHVPAHYLNDHLTCMSDDEVIEVESKFESMLDSFYNKHDYLRAF